MKITSLAVGPIQTNCYILQEERASVCAIIDPGDEPARVLAAVKETACTPTMILLTHGHFDHCTGVRGILENYPDLPVYIHEGDLTDSAAGGGFDLQFPRLSAHNQHTYREGDTLTLGSLTIQVLETPGHSAGSVCLVVDDVIFAGDTLFYGSCGRTDLPGGSFQEILRSLARLARLPGQYRVYPGHDRATDLDFERRMNPYVKQGLAL